MRCALAGKRSRVAEPVVAGGHHADGYRVTARDLEFTDTLSDLPPQTLKEARESVEREMVQDALWRRRGKIISAAWELGISRPTLYELMEKLGIARDS
jgi:two-component system, NtrC family, response regulator